MYSLASASVLAIDLARHPSGAAVADAVDRVLALTPADLTVLAEQCPAAREPRERVLAACEHDGRMSGLMGGVAATVAEGLPSSAVAQTIIQAFAETMMGGLPDLLDMLRHEAPLAGADPVAVQVALDGVAVAWAGRQADLHDLALLRAPWTAGLSPLPPALPESSYSRALGVLLDAISRRTPQAWRRTVDEHGRRRGAGYWSTAMHTSCHAAYEGGRLQEVARAQLAAARALRHSGASTGADAHAVGMAVTAAVQATCTADLLTPDVTTSLLGPWEAGS